MANQTGVLALLRKQLEPFNGLGIKTSAFRSSSLFCVSLWLEANLMDDKNSMSYSKSYRILQLKWHFYDHLSLHVCQTVFGSIRIERIMGQWKWNYCFAEYYDEDSGFCDTPEEGRKKMEEMYLSRLLPALNLIEHHRVGKQTSHAQTVVP